MYEAADEVQSSARMSVSLAILVFNKTAVGYIASCFGTTDKQTKDNDRMHKKADFQLALDFGVNNSDVGKPSLICFKEHKLRHPTWIRNRTDHHIWTMSRRIHDAVRSTDHSHLSLDLYPAYRILQKHHT